MLYLYQITSEAYKYITKTNENYINYLPILNRHSVLFTVTHLYRTLFINSKDIPFEINAITSEHTINYSVTEKKTIL